MCFAVNCLIQVCPMAVGLLIITALILIVILAGCRSVGLWARTAAWIFSNREEKVSLTRLKGHYNPNGYLVKMDCYWLPGSVCDKTK